MNNSFFTVDNLLIDNPIVVPSEMMSGQRKSGKCHNAHLGQSD